MNLLSGIDCKFKIYSIRWGGYATAWCTATEGRTNLESVGSLPENHLGSAAVVAAVADAAAVVPSTSLRPLSP